MKDKTQAAKILLEAGWTWDEIQGVLAQPVAPQFIPYPAPSIPLGPPSVNPPFVWQSPSTWPGWPNGNDWQTISVTGGTAPGLTFTN